MGEFFGFIGGLIQFFLFICVVVAVIVFFGYNALRAFSESIREAMSNIGVVSKKQISLVNQLIDVVKGYQESEKLVMLKVSDDMSSVGQAAQVYQQSNMILSAATGIAQKFPELKANQQYNRLIDSIQACEAQLEGARQRYNASIKVYNIKRSSLPHVFYAATLGFKAASYLEFVGDLQVVDMGTTKDFSNDEDGARLNVLLGQAGEKVLQVGNKALESGRQLAGAAQEKITQITEKMNSNGNTGDVQANGKSCHSCGQIVGTESAFCGACGSKLV